MVWRMRVMGHKTVRRARLQSSEKRFDESRPREQQDSNDVDEWTPEDRTVDDPADPDDDGRLFVNGRAVARCRPEWIYASAQRHRRLFTMHVRTVNR